MDPLFSILVPTRQRPDTLAFTLATVLGQSGHDYEIVVADNCGDEDVHKVIVDAQKLSPRVRHLRSNRILPMAENWERGLAACSGKFITILGDDDGFLPSTLEHIRTLLSISDAKVVNWACHNYWWPDTIAFWNANRLYVDVASNSVEWLNSKSILSAFFRDHVSFGTLPMIYNAFVHRDIINSVQDRFGAYFTPPDLSPDIVSGIINLMNTERYLHSYFPLAVRGSSKKSTGTAHWARAFGKDQRQTYFDEEGKKHEDTFHPSLVASPNLGFVIATVKLSLKDVFLSELGGFQVDLSALVKSTIANLNFEPESYDDNLQDALRLAQKIGFKVDLASIPAKLPPPIRERPQGLSGSPQMGYKLAVDCDQAKIFDVAAAARLAEAMSRSLKTDNISDLFPSATSGAEGKKVGRNELCPCGSGKKHKHCHGRYS